MVTVSPHSTDSCPPDSPARAHSGPPEPDQRGQGQAETSLHIRQLFQDCLQQVGRHFEEGMEDIIARSTPRHVSTSTKSTSPITLDPRYRAPTSTTPSPPSHLSKLVCRPDSQEPGGLLGLATATLPPCTANQSFDTFIRSVVDHFPTHQLLKLTL